MDIKDYNKVFLTAVERTLADYEQNKIVLRSEHDLQSHLFYWCRRIMEAENFPVPLEVFVEKSVFLKHKKVDLVLGQDIVLVELKLEPDYPGVSKPVVFSTKAEAAGSGSVESDLEKIQEYSTKGKHAHFLMIDEDGRHQRKIAGNWNRFKSSRTAYYLHTYSPPKS
jgi:hypothetical protein